MSALMRAMLRLATLTGREADTTLRPPNGWRQATQALLPGRMLNSWRQSMLSRKDSWNFKTRFSKISSTSSIGSPLLPSLPTCPPHLLRPTSYSPPQSFRLAIQRAYRLCPPFPPLLPHRPLARTRIPKPLSWAIVDKAVKALL